MNALQAVVLGVVEGLTEFVPVSSTGHLLVAEHLMGLPTGTQHQKDALIGFTAVIQTGAILAAVLYFLRDILGLAGGFLGGLASSTRRQTDDFRFALAVLVGSLPIGLVGFVLKDSIKSMDTHLWVVGTGLIVFSAVFVVAERRAKQDRAERALTVSDGLVIGLGQCLALVPGVSRSGATISTGLLRGLDRVSATRLSFLLGIPALLAAGLLGLKDATNNEVGTGATVIATVVAFVVAYASIWGLLRFVASHRITAFVPYRVLLGAGILVAVAVS
ncbi:MAG TPA: undecaprenyl-diphosphate phosphatase [Mycobacteriales bacterium]|nr:undecaprenyl-diphosphate phosphatase [Mycobacteriales bacterium]